MIEVELAWPPAGLRRENLNLNATVNMTSARPDPGPGRAVNSDSESDRVMVVPARVPIQAAAGTRAGPEQP
jgi:hypothetical protein